MRWVKQCEHHTINVIQNEIIRFRRKDEETDKSDKNVENLNYIKMWPLIYMYARCESNLVIVHVLPNMIHSKSFFHLIHDVS